MVSNEIYTGAGLSATLIPEIDFDVGMAFGTKIGATNKYALVVGADTASVSWTATTDKDLVPNIYQGCIARIDGIWDDNGSSAPDSADQLNATKQFVLVKSNTTNSITFASTITTDTSSWAEVMITSYGAPVWAVNTSDADNNFGLCSDNWIGLVNTITPPTVDVEMKQLNMAMGGTRNFSHTFKGVENFGEASIDLALNNGSWLYYALGTKTLTTNAALAGAVLTFSISGGAGFVADDDLIIGSQTGTGTGAVLTAATVSSGAITLVGISTAGSGYAVGNTLEVTSSNSSASTTLTVATIENANLGQNATNGSVYMNGNSYYRRENGELLPSLITNTVTTDYDKLNPALPITYTFSESDSGTLPSFALEVTTEKGNVATGSYVQDGVDETLFSRVFTGCQVNSMVLNFEEGQELKSTISAVTRKAHDTPDSYIPKRQKRTANDLFNFSSTDSDNNPYMFSDGTIDLFGQNWARIKSGSLTITNNLTPQRFIGQYDRGIISAYVPGQRTYEIAINLMITDRSMWDYLRTQNETNHSEDGLGLIKLAFEKSSTDKFNLEFDNYIVQSVDIPFPEDKGALEVAVTLQARTLGACTYTGKWVIQG